MSSIPSKRSRSDRVAGLALPPGRLSRILSGLQRGDVLLRIGICALAAIVMWAATGAWAPPFPFRSGYRPARDMMARVSFSRPDPEKTEARRQRKIADTICVYRHDMRPLIELRQALKDRVFGITRAASFDQVDRSIWHEFLADEHLAPTAGLAAQTAETTGQAARNLPVAARKPVAPPVADGSKRSGQDKQPASDGRTSSPADGQAGKQTGKPPPAVESLKAGDPSGPAVAVGSEAKSSEDKKGAGRKPPESAPKPNTGRTSEPPTNGVKSAVPQAIEQVPPASPSEQAFQDFRAALANDMELSEFDKAIEEALSLFQKNGLLENLAHDPEQGSHRAVLVYPGNDNQFTHQVEVSGVRIAQVISLLDQRLRESLAKTHSPYHEKLAGFVSTWIKNRGLPTTLTQDLDATQRQYEMAERTVRPATVDYRPGLKLVAAGKPMTAEDISLLQLEHRELIRQMPFYQMIWHSAADFGMYIAMYVLCGYYIYHHHHRLLVDFRRFATLMGLVVVTVCIAWIASGDAWRAELIPLLVFGMTLAVALDRELALMVSAACALVVTLSLGQGLAEFVILMASISSAVLMMSGIRSRTKLIYVGLLAGIVAAATTIGVGILIGKSFPGSPTLFSFLVVPEDPGTTLFEKVLNSSLLQSAALFGFYALLSGFLMTGLLPFVERLFDVQTDLSLLELGDAAHPLLQELARRAPGTYNHSINVASIAEAAAEAIGAHGLLVRVGAYFHDIGKMLKPGYFVENQGRDVNRHESLLPAMSTLVIIAHVKDGADLARTHHLPHPIIDFVEQHHGTTLVEYFYREAAKRNEQDPDATEVDENNFRYPGPKPQTREAAVMMLADASESASRTLVDPAPARIESLVHEIAMKRLLDGQFDDCDLTLKELSTVEHSLVKSLTAVYHGRIKYPDGNQKMA